MGFQERHKVPIVKETKVGVFVCVCGRGVCGRVSERVGRVCMSGGLMQMCVCECHQYFAVRESVRSRVSRGLCAVSAIILRERRTIFGLSLRLSDRHINVTHFLLTKYRILPFYGTPWATVTLVTHPLRIEAAQTAHSVALHTISRLIHREKKK